MTDGIIQQIIRKWQYTNSKTEIRSYEIHQLEQELIEKIRQKSVVIGEWTRAEASVVGLYELIGDRFMEINF